MKAGFFLVRTLTATTGTVYYIGRAPIMANLGKPGDAKSTGLTPNGYGGRAAEGNGNAYSRIIEDSRPIPLADGSFL